MVSSAGIDFNVLLKCFKPSLVIFSLLERREKVEKAYFNIDLPWKADVDGVEYRKRFQGFIQVP
jgi:hypothetical protein